MTLPERSYTSGSGYRFGFNGKEKDEEVRGEGNSLNFGARNIYNPQIGRFSATDPDDHRYPAISPYAYAINNPINYQDFDGRGPIKPWRGGGYEANFVLGVAAGLVDAGVGIWDVGVLLAANHPVSPGMPVYTFNQPWAVQKRHETNQMLTMAHQIITDKEVRGKVWNSLKEQMGDAWADVSFQDGIDEAGFAHGKILFDAVTLLYGVGELNALIKGEKLSITTMKALRKLKPCGCFTTGTLVLTENGYKNIEDIAEGDLVWAFDEESEELELKEVVTTFTREWNEIYKIYVGDEVIEATNEHPFFIGGKWVNVINLKVGDNLTLYDGTELPIDKIEIETGTFTVYNFEVEDHHNYYVSSLDVLVHNGRPCNGIGLLGKNWKYNDLVDVDWRDTGKTFKEALDEAFKRTGIEKSEFDITEWGVDKYGKETPVEWKHSSGAEVNLDIPDPSAGKNGPIDPHIGYQTGGKRKSGGATRGHIFIDDGIPATRTKKD